MKKFTNDKGEVAIIYSPCYGSGWLDFGSNVPKELQRVLMSDYELAKAVYEEDNNTFKNRFYEIIKPYNNPDFKYMLQHINNLELAWCEEGSVFTVETFDGYESLTFYNDNYLTA